MMCAVAPASQGFEETINTLKYANRAKEIKIQAGQNKRLVSMHVSEYKNIIDDLRREIESLRSQVQNGDASQSVDESMIKMNTQDM
jgi:kinesin family protein 18/19